MANRALPGPKDYAQIPELAQRGLARAQDFFTALDARLQGREFIAGERFSVADITAVVAVDFAPRGEAQAGRAASPPAALARRHGPATVHVPLGNGKAASAPSGAGTAAPGEPVFEGVP